MTFGQRQPIVSVLAEDRPTALRHAMPILRSLVFNIVLYTWTTLLCFALIWTLVLPRRAMMSIVGIYLRSLVLFERLILGLDYRVVGREHVPTGPFVLAAKHQSMWETMKLHLLVDDPAVILKRELMRIPIWGWFAAKARMIPVDRGARGRAVASIVAGARQTVADGRPVVIFPQGTRVPPGSYRSYRIGVFALYEALNLPVVPMALNSGVFWGRRRFIKLPGTITVEFLPPIEPGLDREAFLTRLEDTLEDASERLSLAVGGPPTPRPADRRIAGDKDGRGDAPASADDATPHEPDRQAASG